MKCVKTLGPLAVASVGLMAFVGATSASATVLCKTEINPDGTCPAGWAVGANEEIHAVSETEKPTLTTNFKTLTCDESTMGWTPDSEGDATHTVKGPVSALTFTGSCTCTVVVLKSGTLELHAIGSTGNGTLTSNGIELTAQCSSLFGAVHCLYVTENDDLGTVTGSKATGGTATLDITFELKRAKTTKEGTFCDEEAIWHAKYKVTNRDTLNVSGSSASATVLCTTKVNASGLCPKGWVAPVGEAIHAASETEKPTLTTTFKTITCDESTVSGKVENAGGAATTVKGPVETLTFTKNCNCTVVVIQNGTLEVHAKDDKGNGTLTSTGAEATVQCSSIFGPVHCIYMTENDNLGTITGSTTTGGTATVDITTEVKRKETVKEGSLCDEEAIWHAKYSITTPDTLDVATGEE